MAKIETVDDLLAEQAVRKAITCYSRVQIDAILSCFNLLFTMMPRSDTAAMTVTMPSFVKMSSPDIWP